MTEAATNAWTGEIRELDTAGPDDVLTSETVIVLADFGECVIRVEADRNRVVISEERTGCYGEGATVSGALYDLIADMRQYRDSLAELGESRLAPRLLDHLRFLSTRSEVWQLRLPEIDPVMATTFHREPGANSLTAAGPVGRASSQSKGASGTSTLLMAA